MVKAVIDIGDKEDRILTIVKGVYGLKNKNEAVGLIIQKFEEEILQANLRPENVRSDKATSTPKSRNLLVSKKVKKKNA